MLGLETFRHDLIRGLAVEHTLPTGIISGVEPAQELLPVPVRVDRNAQPLAAHPAVETLHHTIRLWGVRFRRAVLRPEFGTSLDESGSKATAIISEHRGETKGKGCGRLVQEGKGTLLGFIVFDCSMHRARAPVDGYLEVALASFAIPGL